MSPIDRTQIPPWSLIKKSIRVENSDGETATRPAEGELLWDEY